jgi:hypothetical protein
MNADHMLLTVLAEVEVFADVPDDALRAPEPAIWAMVTAGVPYRPAVWVGRPLPSAARMAWSRAARRLARDGMLRRITHAGRDRVRYVRPTAAGLARAIQLAGADADVGAIAEALRRTQWGRRLRPTG